MGFHLQVKGAADACLEGRGLAPRVKIALNGRGSKGGVIMDYNGYHRVDVKVALIFIGGLFLWAGGCYMAFDDAAYYDMVTTGRRRLLDALPRPALQALFAGLLAATVAAVPLKLQAVFARKLSFAIRADGVHAWPLLWRKPGFMKWDDIRHVQRVKDVLIFKGRGGSGGQEASVTLSMVGHSRKKVLAAIAGFRPDIAEALK
jgi:hypothetical protein